MVYSIYIYIYNLLGISVYVTRRRAPIRFLRRGDRNSAAARCDRNINKSSSLNRSSTHRHIRHIEEIVFDIIIIIYCGPGAVDETKMERLHFSDTFSRDETAFFIFMNILSSFLCQGEFRRFKFYRIPIPPLHTRPFFRKNFKRSLDILYII